MEPTKRIIVNTIVQYIKAVFVTALSLYSTRLILDALNISDYGIYSVVGGVVAMLGFITNALIITTQRYISFFYGRGETETVKLVFTNSLFLHLIIGSVLCIILFSLQGWLVNCILKIPIDRIETAHYVYVITVVMLFITIMTTPFKAVFIAHENILFIAIVEMADAIIKLTLAIGLSYCQYDKLLFYAAIMGAILLVNLFTYAIYANFKYDECCLIIKRKNIKKDYLRQLLGFAGWITYGMGAIAGRNQGTAIILNHFYNTAVNAGYGIAFQINGAVSFIVTSIFNAMNPQIMKSEGNNNREIMLKMASMESKFSVALLAIVTLPLIIEMPAILDFWLKDTPPYTCIFCRFILVGFIFDQLTLGLQTANQAIGNLRNYTLLVYTPKLLFIPIVWLMFHYGFSIKDAMWVYVAIELIVALCRIFYTNHVAELSISGYLRAVILPQFPIWIVILIIGYFSVLLIEHPYRFAITYILAATSGIIAAWYFTLKDEERIYIKKLIISKISNDQHDRTL